MYIPRNLISHLYNNLVRTHHPLSPPVLLLVSLDADALCACRILTALFKRDFISHKIQPISGYVDLQKAGEQLVRPMRTTDGGAGGVVVCLGVGGLVDLESMFGLEVDENGEGGMGDVEVWVFDARRPWNLSNVFGMQGLDRPDPITQQSVPVPGVQKGKISPAYRPGKGGIVVFDDGDIEELGAEGEAYCALAEMPDLGDQDDEEDLDAESSDEDNDNDEDEDGERIPESGQQQSRKRRSSSLGDDSESEADEGTPKKRRRSNSSGSIHSSSARPGRRDLLINNPRLYSESLELSSSLPALPVEKQPSARTLRRRLLRTKRRYDSILREYYSLGQSYSEPISAMIYSLASDLGREDNDLLWNTIVGVSSQELSGRTQKGLGLSPISTSGSTSSWSRDRGEQVRAVLRDEVRRLNPPDLKDTQRDARMGDASSVIPTHARSPTDNSIRLSPEPRFLLIRHWSLYESMLHSPYLSAKLHIWSDTGRRRLHKLLAKMGVSLTQCKQNYTHMDMEIKRGLRERLLKFAPVYDLEGLIPPTNSRGSGGKEGWGFVRCWGWKACLSAIDVGVVIGSILEVGDADTQTLNTNTTSQDRSTQLETDLAEADAAKESLTMKRFWAAYDALGSVTTLTKAIPTAQHLYRAILRTGTSLLEKRQIRHLRAFRMGVVKDGPDVALFSHPGALIKLALWVAEAIAEMEGTHSRGKGGELVMAALDEPRGTYVVVGLGGGAGVVAARERDKRIAEKKAKKEARAASKLARRLQKKQLRRQRLEALGEDDSDVESQSDEDDSEVSTEDEDSADEEEETGSAKGKGLNKFGNAFQEVIEQTGARVKVDSFEHCVVEVKKEDLGGFLEALSLRVVVG